MDRFLAVGGAPITASRLLALYEKSGDDDCFSSDLSDRELEDILRPMGASPCLVLLSGSDQYVPLTVDMELLATRLASAIGPTATSRVVPGARHALDGMEELGAEIISGFVSNLI
jgi:hypothetical protein